MSRGWRVFTFISAIAFAGTVALAIPFESRATALAFTVLFGFMVHDYIERHL